MEGGGGGRTKLFHDVVGNLGLLLDSPDTGLLSEVPDQSSERPPGGVALPEEIGETTIVDVP